MCRQNIRALPYVHFHGNESQFDTQQQQQHHRSGNMDCLTITTSFLEERRWRALCPKVAEVKFEPHLHFILKIDPPTDFCVWM